MARIRNINIADEIKSRCNIVDVIGRVVPLKRAGSNYKGLCPFHNEKTPSFTVSESKQIYYCFGCNAGGDVISFVEKYYNLDFKGASEMLASEYGIDISGAFTDFSENREEDYEINRQAARFFYIQLREKKNPGYTYMRRRGISDETLNKFGIGYAVESWSALTDHLTKMGYDKKRLVDIGLVSKSNDRYYDKFRNRVIFPIINTSGKVIGFGGRVIGDGEPKYLNSPESAVFRKKNNLYALNLARKYITDEDEIILVEGYMDVISLFQAGVRNVCASLGTALTENQARLIKRYTGNVVLSYDADRAGQQAAMRGVDILYNEACRVRVLKVSDGKDPDEFIKKNGRKAFNELKKNAMPYGDFKLEYAASGYDLSDDQQRLAYLHDAVDILGSMKPIEADLYIKKLALRTGFSEAAIRMEYTGASQSDTGDSRRAAYAGRTGERNSSKNAVPAVPVAEQDLIKLMLIDHRFTDIPDEIRDSAFSSPAADNIFKAIRENDTGVRPLDMNIIRDSLDSDSLSILETAEKRLIPGGREKEIYNDCISYIKKQNLKRELKKIVLKLELGEGSADRQTLDELMRRQIEIQRQLRGN